MRVLAVLRGWVARRGPRAWSRRQNGSSLHRSLPMVA
jgi:hypothetical protein